MSDSFLSFQSTGQLVCSKSFLDDIVLDILDLEHRDPRVAFTIAAGIDAAKGSLQKKKKSVTNVTLASDTPPIEKNKKKKHKNNTL